MVIVLSFITFKLWPANDGKLIKTGIEHMKIIMATIALVLSISSMASEMTMLEGKVLFDKGHYQINNVKLTGLSLTELRQYEGHTVKMAGEKTSGNLDIYKVFVKTQNGYETSYDWDVVNNEQYEN